MSFQIVAKPTGAACNLECAYCFYLEKERLYPGETDFRMSDSVVESFVRQKIEAHRENGVHFDWQGGEPTLMGLDFFRKAVRLQRRYSNGKFIENSLQTNGILLDDDWCSFFRENNFLVGISIDGPDELHDTYRQSRDRQPTFQRVMKGLECLVKHEVAFNTLTCVHELNAKFPMKVYGFLKEAGSFHMQFIPLAGRNRNGFPSEWAVGAGKFGEFLCTIFDMWVQADVGRYYIQHFEVALANWLGMPPPLCVFAKTCGNAPALEHNGDLYSCDHFVTSAHRLGNIMDQPLQNLIVSEQQKEFGDQKRDSLPAFCRQCDVLFACNGGCPKNRFVRTPDGETGLNYLCSGYKKFFQHIDPCMTFMAEEFRHRRAPANVMRWLKKEGNSF